MLNFPMLYIAFCGIFSLGYFYYKHIKKNTENNQKVNPVQEKQKNEKKEKVSSINEEKKQIQKGKVANVKEIKNKQEGNVSLANKNNLNDWVKI